MRRELRRSFNRFVQNLKYGFVPRKPLLTARLAKRLAEVTIGGRQPLRYVDFALDFTCNQKCEHCFARSYDEQKLRGRGNLSPEDYRRVAREALALGAVSFSIQGGEPFAVLDDTCALLRALPVNRSLVSIKSNGTLITPERASMVRALGVDIVTISLDSGFAEEHDAFRHMKGGYLRALAGARACQEAGIRVMFACTLSHQSVGSAGVNHLVDVTREMGVMLLFIMATPSGRWEGNSDVLLREEDQRWLQETLARNPHCRTDFEANYKSFGCGALKEIVYISQYGDVMSCPFIQVSFGNIREEPLGVIRERGLALPDFSTFANKCLIGEDAGFIKDYIAATATAARLPLPVSEFLRFRGQASPASPARISGGESAG